MDKKIEVGLMLDFYGQLLNEKQEDIVEMYYNQDLSLSEIAEILGITRQGVHDYLKRSENTLYSMESKLKLLERFLDQKSRITEALQLVNVLECDINDNKIEDINNRIKAIKGILENVISN